MKIPDLKLTLENIDLTGYGGLARVHEGWSHFLRGELFGSVHLESTLQCSASLSQSSKDYVQPSPQLCSQAPKDHQKISKKEEKKTKFLLTSYGVLAMAKFAARACLV